MPQNSSPPLTDLLAKRQAGDEESLRRLLPVFCNELRRLARYHLRKERPNHTLQSTALVHEAYMRLMKQDPIRFEQTRELMNKNWIRGLRCRESGPVIAKPTSIKGIGGESSGCAWKAIELTSGDLQHVLLSFGLTRC